MAWSRAAGASPSPSRARPLFAPTQDTPPPPQKKQQQQHQNSAITFLDNHDTGSTLNHWPFPSQHLAEGYAYILTHPGTPTVFYDHLYTEANGLRRSILDLLAVRKRNGLSCRSPVVVRKAAADAYAATIDDRVAVKIGRGDWAPDKAKVEAAGGKRWRLTLSGPGWAVWETE
jgi:alpha-amylase